jgi:hypothetical protein
MICEIFGKFLRHVFCRAIRSLRIFVAAQMTQRMVIYCGRITGVEQLNNFWQQTWHVA